MVFADDFQARPYWWDAAPPVPEAAELPATAEVAIVGGGYTGLSAALTLARLGRRAVVLDAEAIGWGASSRNGGMVSGGLKLARAPRPVAEAAAASLPFVEELIARESIDCAYRRTGRFVPAWTPGHFRALAGRVADVAALTGLPARMLPRERQREELGSDHYFGGMVAEATGALHPAKYARGLAAAARRAGAVLVGGVRVRAIVADGSGFRVRTDRGEIAAARVLTATNGYSAGGPNPHLARRVVPIASYLVATEPLGEARVQALFPTGRMVADTKRVLNYFRPSPDGTRVLWGGRASFRAAARSPETAAPVLVAAMVAVFPELSGVRVTHAWTGNVAFTFDGLPHLGTHEGIDYAAGCQGSGVAMMSWLGHQAGLKLAHAANARFALDGRTMPTVPLYRGRPWFLPLVGEVLRARDRIDRALA